ncbi:SDR family oxidoreductase [Blastococcus sp. URHD0036]|uniref:SDR family NAD(P)-dependent oxidoreductase n=1 Tax=Blastococcus sp. URHD0036 TaxID=1380356 RepID=UPI0004974E95|nr:SDR family oxidoreductase [Blastococcus sp. URHD0036]
MSTLNGTRVVVTGGATGVGRALARQAAARGAEVIVADRDDPGETVAMITDEGGRARGIQADVRDEASLRAAAEEVAGGDGIIDIVCANAGTGAGGTIDELTGDGLRAILDTNVVGALLTVQAFLPALRRARAAGRQVHVLITGSEHSLGVPPYVPPMTAYTTSKHALLGLAGTIRRDLQGDGVGVSILCPGYVRTEMLLAYAAAQPAIAEVLDTYGQDAELVAARAFDGLAAGAFVIPTNPSSVDYVVDLHTEIVDAMKKIPTEG